LPFHITQRGVDRCETFSCADDRNTYLELLRLNLGDADVRILAWCLMTNHVHLIAIPERPDPLAVLFRRVHARVHGRYAQYFNARASRTGHLWQNRFFSCIVAPDHLLTTVAYRCRPFNQLAASPPE
jgi:putative transposase